MAITKLTIDRFTAFEHAEFDLSPGVNVLIGENGSGKTHVLKLLYVSHDSARKIRPPPVAVSAGLSHAETYLLETFRPASLDHLVRRNAAVDLGARSAHSTTRFSTASVELAIGENGKLHLDILHDASTGVSDGGRPAVFLPSREFLTVFPGFIPAYEARELSFDRTYYDLCKQLSATRLRRPLDPLVQAILDPLETALGGEVILDGQTFYVRLKDGDMEATLLAEGMRKIAMLAWLVGNGSLASGSLLLWDEPEAGMNPAMAPLLAQTAFALADLGVQIVMATHDYVLSSELALESERRRLAKTAKQPPAAFFGISREDDTGARTIERGETLSGIVSNPILDAMADLHGRELAFENAET